MKRKENSAWIVRIILIYVKVKNEEIWHFTKHIENNQLTPSLKDELEIYYRDVSQGKFDNLLGDDEIDLVKKDLFDCYHKIFN